jgi:hypothetical protein
VNDIELWSDEYFVDKIERTIKNEISMKFYANHERYPTQFEYEYFFRTWVSKLRCNVTDYDLGNFT